MTKPDLYEDYGVTEQMIDDLGTRIFQLSHNIQKRVGDPYRKLDWPAIELNRENMGLTDEEIAVKLTLEPMQVTFIRTIIESRRFHTGHYKRLYRLGGGKRYRVDREEGNSG